MVATQWLCDLLSAIGFPCLPYDGGVVWHTEAKLPPKTCEKLAKVPSDPAEFLTFDLKSLGLDATTLGLVEEYRASIIRAQRKAIVLDKLAEAIADERVELTDQTLVSLLETARAATSK